MPQDILLHDYDRVRSVTLEEILAETETGMQRALRLGKRALTVWALLSLAVAFVGGAFYVFGGSSEPILVAQAQRVEAKPRIVAAARAEPATLQVAVATPTLSSMQPVEIPAPSMIEARLPRPRPDEPLYTGSVRGPYIPIESRSAEPCETLARLGIPFQLRIRCGRQAHTIAPPAQPRVYYRSY